MHTLPPMKHNIGIAICLAFSVANAVVAWHFDSGGTKWFSSGWCAGMAYAIWIDKRAQK